MINAFVQTPLQIGHCSQHSFAKAAISLRVGSYTTGVLVLHGVSRAGVFCIYRQLLSPCGLPRSSLVHAHLEVRGQTWVPSSEMATYLLRDSVSLAWSSLG